MAPQLTSSEQVARALVLLHGKDPMSALEMLNATSQAVNDLFDNEPDPSDDEVNQAIDDAIQSLGYATDQASLGAQYDQLHAAHAGVWAGNYALLDEQDHVHALLINSTDISLLLDGTDEVFRGPSEGGAFANGRLVVDNDQVALDIAFGTSADGVDLTAADTDLEALAERFQVTVDGVLTIKALDSVPRKLQGKRGVSTAAGVLHDRGEEPPAIWAGTYQLRYTDTELWELADDPLVIACDPATQQLSVSVGARQGTDVFYRAGVISCALPATKGDSTRLTMDMHCTSGGKRKCYLWFETTGQVRTMTGYADALLDASVLLPTKKESPAPRRSLRANAARPAAFTATLGGSVVDFCRTPYDSTFDVGKLIAAASDAGRKTPADLFAGDSIKLGAGAGAQTVSGFRVDETDAQGNATGRVAMFTYTPPATETRFYPKATTLKSYQQLDTDGIPQLGLANACVGVLDASAYELPGLVETDFYEVRMSLTAFSGIDPAGLRLDLAIDDPRQPGLIAFAQPIDTTCPYDGEGGNGPDTSVMSAIGDFTKASALVRGTTGETQVVGHKSYHVSALPRTDAKRLTVTRTLYAPNGDGSFTVVGTGTQVEVPFLLHVPIEMDSRDALEIVGGTWMPAARGKQYSAAITATRGQQPFTWRILQDSKPGGLNWSESPVAPSLDIQKPGLVTLKLSGTVDSGTDPGSTFQPIVRVMSDRSCVMKPAIASPQLTVVEPDTENKQAAEVANVVSTVVAAVAAIGSILVGIVIYKKQVARETKKEGSDKTIELSKMSVDSLSAYGKDLKKIAAATKEIKANAGFVYKVENAMSGMDEQIVGLEKKVEALKEMLKKAEKQAEKTRLEEEVRIAQADLQQSSNEKNDLKVERDSINENDESE
ncbi:hypothetical protein QLQ15_13425 [Lysobacter sp. LF1]|uniref:Uncharacterized protein n=1 Tax=Lysobacter stagni TaxID=3045172 RepID=A0ABT6XID1_9GAMM|nr:hypothetical protein [Lysobacter sp. LF1]MDI9239907.1 hypothetical protein [Lysobacter sp. LF1]